MSDVKKKLFIPRKIDERLVEWNNMQPIIDGVKINQYDIKTGEPTGRWGEGDFDAGDTIDLFGVFWDVFGLEYDVNIEEQGSIFNSMVLKVKEDLVDVLSETGPLGENYYDLTIPLHSKAVFESFKILYKRDLPLEESEQPKNKLFIPRKLSGENSRWSDWNKGQPIVDGVRINQYDLDGKEQGYWEFYNDFNGSVYMRGSYKNGKKYGVWEFNDINGKLLYKELFKNGKKIENLRLDESEEPKKKLFIPRKLTGEDNRYSNWNKEQPIVDGIRINQYDVNGNKQGIWEEYDKGKLESRVRFKDGKWDGIYQTFHPNGQIQYDGQTKDDNFDGIWEKYYITGQLRNIGEYNDGLMVGIWKWYYPFNNQLETIKNYINGNADGLSIEYNMDGGIWKKIIYSMDKKIASIKYAMDGSVSDSMNWEDEYDDMVIKEQIENKDDILKSWVNYYGSDDTANWELESYESEVEDLIENGGNIYRCLFVDDISEVKLNDIGHHWTISRDNVIDVIEINQQYYGKDKKKTIVIEAYVEPNSITIDGVDVKGNPHEKEVNIIKGKDVKIKQIFEYIGRKFIPININEGIDDRDNILKSFELQKELNPKIWDEDDKLKKKIKDTLIAIGQEFHKSLEVEAPIEDIIFTGSLANYNWSQYSDIDLHVLIDFNEFDDKELIKKYFDAKKAIWNDSHDIKIKGYDVELYAQDMDEPHESTGIYSVMNDEWIKKPKPQDVKIDKYTIKKKVKQFGGEYNRIIELYKGGKYEETRTALDKIKDKIKKYRKAGLDKDGEMSTENLVFKTMRRSGLIEKIYNLGIKTTDKEYTIETIDESKKLFIPRKISGENSRWSDWNKNQPMVDGKRINQYDLDGRKQGYWETYYNNGNLESKGDYVNGMRDGIWEYYYWNGTLERELYNNGEIVKNPQLSETEDKKLFIPRKLSKDDSRYSDWNNKQPIVDGIRINQYNPVGGKDGMWYDYWDNGELYTKGNFTDGLEDGIWETYTKSGILLSKGGYKDGNRDGIWEYYYFNSEKLEVKISYRNGYYDEELPINESKNINEGELSDNIDDILKRFKKNIGLDVGFLASFGAGINGLIRNVNSLMREYTPQPLNAFEITNLSIALIVVYLRNYKSLKDFKDGMLSIVAFTSLMPGYNDMVNSLLGNVDFMDAFMTIIKSVGVYSMLNHFKSK
jgi:antitoxin component YwqK of YwqJK toxin-antitoxin module